jgi:uncharacterized protein with FMN-binding domain
MSSWQKVYDDNQEYRASIVKAILKENHIDAVIVNKKDTNYQFGSFEVHVVPDDVIKALKIIQDEIEFK